jgi:hypothetical protein
MVRSWRRRYILVFALIPFLGPPSGCSHGDGIANVPQLRPAAVVDPDKQPKALRPGSGSSAGMTYDPGGPPP